MPLSGLRPGATTTDPTRPRNRVKPKPTNNRAERAIRPAVLWRKGSFGTHSVFGSSFVERILSVVASLKQQGRNAMEFLVAATRAYRAGQPSPSLLPAA